MKVSALVISALLVLTACGKSVKQTQPTTETTQAATPVTTDTLVVTPPLKAGEATVVGEGTVLVQPVSTTTEVSSQTSTQTSGEVKEESASTTKEQTPWSN